MYYKVKASKPIGFHKALLSSHWKLASQASI